MVSNKLLSIVIPTKNRYDTLNVVLESLLNLDDFQNLIEVVIHDNSDIECTLNAKFYNHKNIIYIKYPDYLTVSENCDKAVSYATADYILMIGDDDSVCIDIIKYVRKMKNEHIESSCFKMARYFWPGVKNESLAKIQIPRFNSSINFLNPNKLFKNSISESFQEIRYLPRCYHAICSKKTLDQVYKKFGSYFPGPSPDMANAVAVTLQNPRHVFINKCLMISGYSKASTAGLGQNGMHIGKIEDQAHLDKDILKDWPSNVCKIWTGETIWYISALYVLKKINFKGIIPTSNMNARIYFRYGNIFDEHLDLPNKSLYFTLIYTLIKKIYSKLVFLDFPIFDLVNEFSNISIVEFQQILNKRSSS